MRLAGSLVARQRYLPGTEFDAEGKLTARWRPVWITEDLRYLDDLARAMPAAARAIVTNGVRRRSGASVKVVKRFVEQLVDHIVRTHREPEAEDGIVSVSASLFAGEDRPTPTCTTAGSPRCAPSSRAARQENELEDFEEQIRDWRKPLDVAICAPFRLCFRLEEPAPPRRSRAQQAALRQAATARRAGARRCARDSAAGTCATCCRAPTIRRCSCRPPTRGSCAAARPPRCSARAATCTRRCCSRSRRRRVCVRGSR